MDEPHRVGAQDMKPSVQELFQRAAEDVGLKVRRSGAMIILSPKKQRPGHPAKGGKNGKAR